MAGTFKAWTLIDETLFTAQCRAIESNAQRMDEILDGIKWGLAQNPRQGFPVSGYRLWVIKTDPFPGAPKMRVWYTINDQDETVSLKSIERIEEAEG